jgi:hypothetical protein
MVKSQGGLSSVAIREPSVVDNDRVAVGIPVAWYPPHGSPRAALPHEALIVDAWRQSQLWDRDEGRAVVGATGYGEVGADGPRRQGACGRADGMDLLTAIGRDRGRT